VEEELVAAVVASAEVSLSKNLGLNLLDLAGLAGPSSPVPADPAF